AVRIDALRIKYHHPLGCRAKVLIKTILEFLDADRDHKMIFRCSYGIYFIYQVKLWRAFFLFFSSSSRHTRFDCDWSSDVCSSDLRSAGRSASTRRSRIRSPTPTSRPSSPARSPTGRRGASPRRTSSPRSRSPPRRRTRATRRSPRDRKSVVEGKWVGRGVGRRGYV